MFLKAEQQLVRCERVVRQRVRPHIHPVLAHCKIHAFGIPGEPISARQFFSKLGRDDIDFHDFHAGELWGTTWGTVWFEITGTVPSERMKGRAVELMLDLGWFDHSVGGHIEGLAYRRDGTVIKAVHPRNYWVPLISESGKPNIAIAEDGSFAVYLEAACNPLLLGVPPFIETELGDHATGKPEEPYIFKAADVCELNRAMEDYWLDLDVVSSLMKELDADSPRYWQLAKALQRSLNAFDEQRLASVSEAREALAGVLSRRANDSAMKVTAVGHAHIDSAWLWPVRETRRKVARTVSNVLALMDEDPRFTYAMSSAQQYAWLEQDHPDLFARVKQRIDEGRFIPVGGMWVESDGMLPAGESLIRQITFGRRYFKEHLGVQPRGIWLPDSFGYTGAWPQIARRAGYEWFLTQKISWNDTTKFPHHSFMWQGIDGTPILTHFPPSDTYAAEVSAKELAYAERNFQDKDLADRSLMLFGYGDGGGGPTREMMGRVDRYRDLEGVSKVSIGTPDSFFEQAREQLERNAGSEMPGWKGELYLELHRGTLTAQQEMKRGCREEESMLRAVEYLGAAASIGDADYQYPAGELDRIWKTLMLNQFHDILPGSGISWVHREARNDYARDIPRLRELAEQACEALSESNNDAEVLPDAVITPFSNRGEAWLPASTRNTQAEPATIKTADDGAITIGNGVLTAIVRRDGTLSSLHDEANDRELIPKGTRLGGYELLTDEPSVWDAWDIERDALLRNTMLTGGSIIDAQVVDGVARVSIRIEFAKSSIDTVVTLAPGANRVNFNAEVDWHECERFLKVDLPLALVADRAQYDCQYGVVERPIVKNTASDEAKYESCTHRFIRVRQSAYAAAVVNSSTYGSDASPIIADMVKGRQTGTLLRLSLLSSPVFPDPRTDLGRHEFAWALVLDATIRRTLGAACEINAPVLHDVPAIRPLVSMDDVCGIPVIDWIKLAGDGSGDLIVRLYEAAGDVAEATLKVADGLKAATVFETNLLETPDLPAGLPVALVGERRQPIGNARIHLGPFQLATLRIER